MNYTIPPRLKASDYSKGRITQDEIIALQIANDANISSARKAVKMGEIQGLTPVQTDSPEELLADVASQEANARTNIEKLGFRPQEASQIVIQIANDPQLDFSQLNSNFPAIEADIKKRFNVKLLTPTFFIEYFRKYSSELDNVVGARVFNTSGNNNGMINNIQELRRILPDRDIIEFIAQRAADQHIIGQQMLDDLDNLARLLPNPADFQALANLAPVQQQRIIQDLLTQFENLPSRDEMIGLANLVNQDRVSRAEFLKQIKDIIDSAPVGRQRNIIEDEVGSGKSSPIENILGRAENSRDKKIISEYQNAVGRVEQERTINEIYKAYGSDKAGLIINVLAQQKSMDAGIGKAIRDMGIGKAISDMTGTTTESATSLGSAISLDTATMKEIKATFRANPELADKLRGPDGNKINYNDLQKNPAKAGSRKFGLDDTNIRQIFQEKFGRGINRSSKSIAPKIKMKVGRGLSVKQTPSYREYGKYAIHIPQLEQQDILNVKYKSLGQIPKFKPVPVSDIFRDFVIDLLDNGKPNARVYTQIPTDERKFFEEMSIGAGVWNSLGLKRTTTSTDEEENKTFELLKGEYLAGNNSPKVISSLRQLVVKMMNDGRIRRSQGVDLLMELSI